MNTPAEKSPAKPRMPKKNTPRAHRRFSALEKVQAVLSIWTESRKPSHICKEMGITWLQLNNWQDKGLRAMIEALEPPQPTAEAKPSALPNRLRKLLEKQNRKSLVKPAKPEVSEQLSQRLSNLTGEA